MFCRLVETENAGRQQFRETGEAVFPGVGGIAVPHNQLSYITHSNSGEGLLFYGNVTIPFMDRFPRGEIYDLLTTRPEDLKDGAAG